MPSMAYRYIELRDTEPLDPCDGRAVQETHGHPVWHGGASRRERALKNSGYPLRVAIAALICKSTSAEPDKREKPPLLIASFSAWSATCRSPFARAANPRYRFRTGEPFLPNP